MCLRFSVIPPALGFSEVRFEGTLGKPKFNIINCLFGDIPDVYMIRNRGRTAEMFSATDNNFVHCFVLSKSQESLSLSEFTVEYDATIELWPLLSSNKCQQLLSESLERFIQIAFSFRRPDLTPAFYCIYYQNDHLKF